MAGVRMGSVSRRPRIQWLNPSEGKWPDTLDFHAVGARAASACGSGVRPSPSTLQAVAAALTLGAPHQIASRFIRYQIPKMEQSFNDYSNLFDRLL